jgi:hypothetical protein
MTPGATEEGRDRQAHGLELSQELRIGYLTGTLADESPWVVERL